MKMLKDTDFIVFPEVVDVSSLEVGCWSAGNPQYNPDAILFLLPMIGADELFAMRAKQPRLSGCPMYFAVTYEGNDQTLQVYPTLDADYYFDVIYNPARKKW